jgi:hypothetical protein
MRKKAELREVKRLHSKDKVSCMRWVEKWLSSGFNILYSDLELERLVATATVVHALSGRPIIQLDFPFLLLW